LRIGIGYDVHSLQTGRKLVLGGVHIPFDRGLLGHSDADVLLHAICDALLGAAALGDIGQHFPNTDPAYKNIESLLLLNQVNLRLAEAGYRVKNIDSTIIAQITWGLPSGYQFLSLLFQFFFSTKTIISLT
jgi:2-C-methyl-D-erythritol 2,4-cyclodiphosphate synthase